MRWMLWALLFAGVYLGGSDSWSLGNLMAALALGALLAMLMGVRREQERGPRLVPLLPILRLFLAIITELLRGGITVLGVVTGLKTWRRVGWVELPVGRCPSQGAVVLGWVATATPGTILVELNEQRRTMLFNAIDASDPEAVRSRLEQFYERYLAPVLR